MRRLLAVIVAGFVVMLGYLPAGADAAPASSDCVGLVVDFGGGSVQSTCVPFHQGMTGTEVLTSGNHRFVKGGNGIICRIDGRPGKCTSDVKHYWSYYHRAPGGQKWAFSMKGPDQYRVHPGETEGWAWINGKTRQPKSVPYARLKAAAAPTATPLKPSTSKTPSAQASKAASDEDNGGGTPWGLIVGIIAIVVIVAAGFWVQRARRSQP